MGLFGMYQLLCFKWLDAEVRDAIASRRSTIATHYYYFQSACDPVSGGDTVPLN